MIPMYLKLILTFSAKVIFPALTITKDPFTGELKSSKSFLVPKLAWISLPQNKDIRFNEHHGIRIAAESETEQFYRLNPREGKYRPRPRKDI